jgi:hypothetical protein
LREVAQVRGDDAVRMASHGGGDHVRIVPVGQFIRAKGAQHARPAFARHFPIGDGFAHVVAPLEQLAGQLRSVFRHIAHPFIFDGSGPFGRKQAGGGHAQQRIAQCNRVEDARVEHGGVVRVAGHVRRVQ